MAKLLLLACLLLLSQIFAQSPNDFQFRPLLGLNLDHEIELRGQMVSAWEEALKLRLNNVELSLQWVFKGFNSSDHVSNPEQKLSPVFMFWWFGSHAHYSTRFEELVADIPDYMLGLEKFINEVVSTYVGDVYVVLEPEYNIGFLRKSPRFGLLMAEAAERMRDLVQIHPRVNLKIGLGIGDFGDKLKAEDEQEWATYEPSLSAAAPTMDFLSFVEMPRQYDHVHAKWDCHHKSAIEWEEIHEVLPQRALSLAKWLKNKYDRNTMLHYYNALYYSSSGDWQHEKLLERLKELNDEYVMEGLFAITPLHLFDDQNSELYHDGFRCDSEDVGGLIGHSSTTSETSLKKAGETFVDWSQNYKAATPTFPQVTPPPKFAKKQTGSGLSNATISSIYPSTGLATGGTTITVFGQGFSKGTPEKTFCVFNGDSAVGAQVLTDSMVICVTPVSNGVLGTVNFTLTLDLGVSYTAPVNWMWYLFRPVLSFVTPSSAPITGNVLPSGITTNLTRSVIVGGGYLIPGFNLRCQFGSLQPTPAVFSGGRTDRVLCPVPAVIRARTVNLRVFYNANTLSTPLSFEFLWNVPRLIASFPASSSAVGGSLVTVVGRNFNHYFYAWCKFGDAQPTDAQVLQGSAYTRVTCLTPPSGVVGCVNLTVSNDGTSYSNPVNFCFDAAVPQVLSITPDSAPVNQQRIVRVNGTQFSKFLTTWCSFGTAGLSVATVLNSTSLTCLSPLLNASQIGVYPFTVITRQTATSNSTSPQTVPFRFTITTPVATNITPEVGPFIGGTSVTIRGLGFLNATVTNLTCFFGSQAVPARLIAENQVVCVSPPAEKPGVVGVSVGNDAFAGSNPLNFTYLPFTPTLFAISPTSGHVLETTPVVINGTFLADREKYFCHFGDADVPAAFATSTSVSCVVPPAKDCLSNATIQALYDGLIPVSVSTSNGPVSNKLYFRYVIPTPIVVDIAPVQGPVGTVITILGRDFFPGTKFRCQFDGDLYAFASKVDEQTIQCVVPPRKIGKNGKTIVRVTNDLVGFSSPLAFTYTGYSAK